MYRVLSIFGTRPEAIKMAPVVQELEKHRDVLESVVCVTAQHREMLDEVLALFGIDPDIDLDLMSPDQTLASLTGQVVMRVDEVLGQVRPDLILVQGDTTTVMAAALAAFYRRIPVGHVEAGLRTMDRYMPFPEEINRRITGQLASVHFAPTQGAADALLAEGVPPQSVYVTGNTVIDSLHWVVRQEPPREIEEFLARTGVGQGPNARRLILVTAHRRESFGRPLEQICVGVRELARRNPDLLVVYPVHPNPRVRESVQRLLGSEARIELIGPMPYLSFAHLMKHASLVLTDSGGIQEEAPALGIPVLVLRHETERQEAVAAGTVKLVGPNAEAIVREAENLLYDALAYAAMARAVSPYGDGRAAERIARIIGSLAREAQPSRESLSVGL